MVYCPNVVVGWKSNRLTNIIGKFFIKALYSASF